MKSVTFAKWMGFTVGGATIVIGSVIQVAHPTASYALVLAGLAVLGAGVWHLVIDYFEKLNTGAVDRAQREYSLIQNHMKWVGKDAEIVAERRIWDGPGHMAMRVNRLCRTTKGAWFNFEALVEWGRVRQWTLRPINESDARCQLQHFPATYVHVFGEPPTA